MAERLTARVIRWNAEKNFGFLRWGSKDLFLHVRDFAQLQRTPRLGDLIQFSIGTDRHGRPCATDALQLGAAGSQEPDKQERFATSLGWSLKTSDLILLLILVLTPALAIHQVAFHPGIITVVWLTVSAIAYLLYAVDKQRAGRREWRVSEATLHFISLLGGWPGSFLAQQHFHHKTSKLRFQLVFWLTVLVWQLTALDYLLDWKLFHAAWRTCTAWWPH